MLFKSLTLGTVGATTIVMFSLGNTSNNKMTEKAEQKTVEDGCVALVCVCVNTSPYASFKQCFVS